MEENDMIISTDKEKALDKLITLSLHKFSNRTRGKLSQLNENDNENKNPTAGSYSTLKDWKAFPPKQEQDKNVIFGKPKLFYSKSCNHSTLFFHPHSFSFIHLLHRAVFPTRVLVMLGAVLFLCFSSAIFCSLKCLFPLKFCLFSGFAQLLGGCL